MITLYCAPNTISVAVAIALEEAHIPWQAKRIDFANAEQTKPGYLGINPKGRVPALDTGAGLLTETGAILEWIGAQAPSLVPTDPMRAARMREAMFYFASTMHVNHAHKMRGSRWADQTSSFDDMRAKVPQTMAASCAYLEATFALDPYVTGDSLTLADPYLFAITTWLAGDQVDVSTFPKIAGFAAVMRARPSVGAVYDMGLL